MLLKVESEGRSILPAQKHRSCRRLAFSRLVCARCIQQIPRESHACFLTHRREDGVEGRGRVVAGCGAENGQKKHGCITDNTTLCRHRRPTLLSVTRAISPRPPVNEVHRRQREPTSGLPAFFPGYTATSKEFCVADANQSPLRLLLLIFFFLSRS